jgi:uncharacterized peroxidase-related enzyme
MIMMRIAPIEPATTTGQVRTLLSGVQKKHGFLPTLMRVLAHSPAALDGYLSFSAAPANGVLSRQLRERIAIAVAKANSCDCCLAGHRYYGRQSGLSEDELEAARESNSADSTAAAVLRFIVTLRDTHGHVSDAALADVRAAGLEEAVIVEIAAAVAVNMFTNFVINIAQAVPDLETAPHSTRR